MGFNCVFITWCFINIVFDNLDGFTIVYLIDDAFILVDF